MQIANYWVDIENSNGVRLGRGPLRAWEWQQKSPLSSAGSFSFTVSIADPNLDALDQKRVAICRYVDQHGEIQTLGGGVIEKITMTTESSMLLKVEGIDLTRELTYRSVGTLSLAGVEGAGVTDAPDTIMARAPENWSILDGTTLTAIYAGFDGETVLNALTRCGEHIGEHWRLGNGRILEWLGPASSFAASGVRAVQHVNDPAMMTNVDTIVVISSLEEVVDSADLVSRVIPRGSGNGGAVLTLANISADAPAGYTVSAAENYVIRNDTETLYGRIERALDFKELGPLSNTTPDVIAAADMLLQAAVEHLRRYGAPQKFYRLQLANGSPYLRPGTTLHVVYRSIVSGQVLYDLDDNFIILEVSSSLTAEGLHSNEITVSTIDRMAQSDAEYLARQVAEAKILSTHQQLGASVDTLTYRDEMDKDHGASMRFWVGDEYTSIQRAVLRFKIQPLRSTVKSIGGTSMSTEAGGGGTSGSGGSSTPTSSTTATTVDFQTDHTHFVAAAPGNTGGGGGHNHTMPSHNHSVSIGTHSHTIDDHTHEITAEVEMLYGIFEQSGANTLALSDLAIRLNSGSDLRSSVVSLVDGWYELDITDPLTDDVFRPAQENNEIEITTAVEKTARIEAQITIRGVVQAIAYS